MRRAARPTLVLVKSSSGATQPKSPLRQWQKSFLNDKRMATTINTREKYRIAISQYIDHVGRYHWPPTRFDVNDFLYTVRNRASEATAFAYWSVIRNWFNYIYAAGGFEEYPNPAEQIRLLGLSPAEPRPEPRGVPDAHIKTLFAYLDRLPRSLTAIRDKTLLRFIWRTGARSGEASRLKLEQIDWSEQCVRLSAKDTKNRKGRTLYFGKKITGDLKYWTNYLSETGYSAQWVFPSVGHKGSARARQAPLTVSGTRRMFQRRCSQAGIPAYTVHELRHTFTKDAINSKLPLDAIRRQLGHSSTTMVLRYAKVFDDEQARVFTVFGD